MITKMACDEVLQRRVIRWAWDQQRPITAAEVAKRFNLPNLHCARCLIQKIMRRADGLQCFLETVNERNENGKLRHQKYFTVLFLPDSYLPTSKIKPPAPDPTPDPT